MTRMVARTKFHSSKLVRCLAGLKIGDDLSPGDAFAEKLGEWIHFADAIALSAVHGDGIAGAAGIQPHASDHAAGAEFDRVRSLLADSIVKSFLPAQGRPYISLPAPAIELPMNAATAYMPYRRFYEAHQRDMELRVPPLRVNLREAVARKSPRLAKLAELDAAFEKILRERESKLLSRLPVLLKKRFEQLFDEHQKKLAAGGRADIPAAWAQPGGWLARFCGDMQMLLLAELELRLQPAMGLVEACNQESEI